MPLKNRLSDTNIWLQVCGETKIDRVYADVMGGILHKIFLLNMLELRRIYAMLTFVLGCSKWSWDVRNDPTADRCEMCHASALASIHTFNAICVHTCPTKALSHVHHFILKPKFTDVPMVARICYNNNAGTSSTHCHIRRVLEQPYPAYSIFSTKWLRHQHMMS